MAGPVELAVGTEHGSDCTCKRLDAIEFTVTPVVVDRSCPGLNQPAEPKCLAGRLIITWPAPRGGVIAAWGVTLADADTGEPIVMAMKVELVLGSEKGFDGVIEAAVTALVNADGQILAAGAQLVPDENGEFRTGVFRYAVAEMRVAEPGTSNPADGGC